MKTLGSATPKIAGAMMLACATLTPQHAHGRSPEVADARKQPRFLPLPESVARPQEAAALSRMLKKITEAETPASAAPILDEALRELPEPTSARGLIQFWRADILSHMNRYAEAVDAIEESIRLLPNYSGPLLGAATIYAYANQPAKGTDYFLRASRIDPETVRRVDDYEVDNLIRRLGAEGDQRRVNILSDRLLQIGWVGSNLGSRSALARSAIERRVKDGDVQGAKALVPKLLVPSHSYALLVNNDLRTIWPDLEMWGGSKLQSQWQIYMREARERWGASKDTDAVRDYSAALLSAGHDRTVIREILPLFYGKLDQQRDQDLIFVATGVADALAREGRWDDIDRLFTRAQAVWPLEESNPNSLNIASNQARYLLYAGKHKAALAKMDAALDLARKWQVNPDAITSMHHYRACILHQLGRAEEAGLAMAVTASHAFADEVARLHLCMGNEAAALRVLLDGLKSERDRKHVLLFVQPDSLRPFASPYGRDMQARIARVQGKPELLSSIATYGRVLPFAPNDGAPPETP